MKIKVNDNVLVIAGKDKGKSGKVIKTLKNENKVVVEGINISKRHTKPRTNNDKGGIFEIEMPIHVSNVKKVEEAKASKKSTKKASK
ncbi:MAG: 50S ribosomal protein L24 [Bacilli bacterium]|nr:50S ribosomal protein L24 [Bacilli bacterium]